MCSTSITWSACICAAQCHCQRQLRNSVRTDDWVRRLRGKEILVISERVIPARAGCQVNAAAWTSGSV